LYESELIKIHQPLYNRKLRRNNFSYGLFSYLDTSGYKQLYIDRLTKNTQLPLTTFTTKKEANDTVFQLVEKHQLCLKLCGMEKSAASCFGYQVKKCHGACVTAESTDSYNERVSELEQSLTFDDQAFFLIESGRDKKEKGVVWIENGSYKGFGFVPFYFLKQPAKSWQQFIDLRPEDKDARTILRYYLRKFPEMTKRLTSE
jgi:DNA polymerase-3 subunit epsilon